MAYIALYRKYRPRNFDEVVGQDPIIKTLKNAITQDKIAHAYLFCGPRGTGKTSVAKIFSMAVNCTSENKPCMQCESCLSFLDGDSPDVIEIDAASNNGVEEVRDLIDKVKYAPQVSKYKVYIIDEVHMMSVSAFNALLKTIEEPPKHVIFILATTDPHKVIPTIISRCQRYDFNSVSIDTMIYRLNEVMDFEEIRYEAGVSERIAVLSDGGMRDALSILDQCVAYAGNNLKLEDIDNVYGSLNSRDLCSYIEYIIEKDTVNLFKFLNDINNKGVDIKRVTQDLISTIKNILFYSYTKDEMNIQFMNKQQVDSLLSNAGEKKLIYYSECLIEANEKMKSSSDIQTYFELTSLKMLQQGEDVSRETIDTPDKPRFETIKNNVSRETFEEIKPEIVINNNPIEEDNSSMIEDSTSENYEIDEVYDDQNQDATVNEPSNNLINKEKVVYEEDYLLRLLLSANKDFKQDVTEKYERIMEYANEFEWAKQSNVLRNIDIVAAGPNYMIVKATNKIHAELIEDKKNEAAFQSFVKELFGDYKHIYALAAREVESLINEYVTKRSEGTLPEPLILEDIKVDEITEEVDETTKRVIELFGEDNINMEE